MLIDIYTHKETTMRGTMGAEDTANNYLLKIIADKSSSSQALASIFYNYELIINSSISYS